MRKYLYLAIVILILAAFEGYGLCEPKSGKVKPPVEKPKAGSKGKFITMNFNDVELRVFVQFISDLTGKNFLIDPDVKGKITVISPNKVSVGAAYKVFLSVLEVHGYTTVQSGRVIKIIPLGDAKSKAVELRTGKSIGLPEDKIITQLVPLIHGDSSRFAKLLKPLIPKTGLLIAYPDTNTLIINDVESNITRLLQIIKELDMPASKEKIAVIGLDNASAESLAPKLRSLFQRRRGKTAITKIIKIVADDRTNSLIILAAVQTISDIERVLEKLDQKQVRPRGNIHIYALQNAVAEDVAKVLGQIPGKGGAKGKKKVKAPPLSKDVQITADKATNTLVIVAEPEEYQILEGIIKKLDVRRTMVYVEALIMEVSNDKSLELGVEWRVGDDYRGGLGTGAGGHWSSSFRGDSNVNNLSNLESGSMPIGFGIGVLGRGITLGDVVFPSIGAFIKAVRADSDFNIISTPQLLILNNEEATIEVGQTIPFVTRVDQGTSVDDRAIQSFEYKDVGVTLKVTPQINDNRYVRLTVEQSVKTVLETTALGGTVLAPTTAFRTTKSSIAVKDGETAVMGGLMDTQMTRGKTQTPCLGDIPGIGWAFKRVSDRDHKTNLLVFLTPHIIENPAEGRRLYKEKKAYMDKEVEEAIELNQPEKLRQKGFE